MPRLQWALRRGRPCVEIVLTLGVAGSPLVRTLLADTGAGSQSAPFQLALDEEDCLLCGGNPLQAVSLRGAYSGTFPTYSIAVQLPSISFDEILRAVGVSKVPDGFDGIASFSFLNRFAYGNFGDFGHFGLEK